MQPTLLILAAGMGSRYGGLKQLESFGPSGETILEYSVYDAIRAGFGKIVFVIRREFEQAFKEKIGNRFADIIEVVYVYQEITSCLPSGYDSSYRGKPRGTGHAVLVAKDVITTPFAVINADDYYGISGFTYMANYLREEISSQYCSMIGYVLAKTLSPYGVVNRGVCEVDENNNLTSVKEWHKLGRRDDGNIRDMHDRMIDDNSIVSMNFWGFDSSIFTIIEELFLKFLEMNNQDSNYEFYIPSVVNHFIHNNRKNNCKVIPCDAQRCGVTYVEDKKHTKDLLNDLINKGSYPPCLRKK